MNKKLLLAGLIAAMTGASVANAEPVFNAGENDIFFTNSENWVDENSNGLIDQGDLFYGIYQAQGIKNDGVDIWGQDNVAPGLDTLTGYFVQEVASTTDLFLDTNGNQIVNIDFTVASSDPNGIISNADLANGVMLVTFTDTTTAYEENGTVADDIGKATDGTAFMSFGLVETGDYWYSDAALEDPTGTPASGNTLANNLFGLSIIDNNTGYSFSLVNDPDETAFDSDVDFYGNTEIQSFTGNNTDWMFTSNDPGVLNRIPEPTALLLMGAGILGFGLSKKKRS